MIESKKLTLVDKENIQIDLEYNEHYAVIHVPRFKVTKSTYQDFMITVDSIYEFLTTIGYENMWAGVDPYDPMIAKLLGRVGAVKLGTHDGIDVYEYKGEA